MPLDITAFFAAIHGLFFLLLSARVILQRRSAGIAWGDGDDREMKRRIRAQANAAEYMPIGLILLGLLEIQGLQSWALLGLGALFLAGRLIHGWAFSFAGAPMGLRVLGTALTLTGLGLLSLAALVLALI